MWLLLESVRKTLESYMATVTPSADNIVEFEASISDREVLRIAGTTGQIPINGILTKKPDWFARFFGGGNTTYGQIVEAIAEAEANDDVQKVVFAIDSPGGTIDGLFEALAAMQTMKKPSEAIVTGVAASSAYALASQADTIVAMNQASMFGSIGVAVDMRVREDVKTLTSTEAPKKRPDVTTKQGQKDVIAQLDAIHEIFVEAIATGRSTTVKKVNADFGRGATLLAKDALKLGMIDSIETTGQESSNVNATASKGGDKLEKRPMDLNTLKADHPDVYAAAVELGATQERDRVSAHLTMGEASGDMDTARAAIEDGSEMTAGIQAKYMAASMNRKDENNRADDDDDASGADNAKGSDDEASDVMAIIEDLSGVDS